MWICYINNMNYMLCKTYLLIILNTGWANQSYPPECQKPQWETDAHWYTSAIATGLTESAAIDLASRKAQDLHTYKVSDQAQVIRTATVFKSFSEDTTRGEYVTCAITRVEKTPNNLYQAQYKQYENIAIIVVVLALIL